MPSRSWIAVLLALFATACALEDSRSALGAPASARSARRRPTAEDLSRPAGVADSEAGVVFASDPDAGFRLAARRVRAGIQEVSVVRGGVTAWLAAGNEPLSG